MKVKKHFKLHRLYLELMGGIIGSFLLSAALFFTLQFCGEHLLNTNKAEDYYLKKLNEDSLSFSLMVELQHYSIQDFEAFGEWSKDHPLTFYYLIRGEREYFDSFLYSMAPEFYDLSNPEYQKLLENPVNFDTISGYHAYTIHFSDGEGTLYIVGDYQYGLKQQLFLINLFISVIFGLILIFLLVRKKIHYIADITEGIHIFEHGDLTYEIPIRGRDELSDVAGSLNSMKDALRIQMENEKEALMANSELVTALSHDLRTPLTTQMGYLEILKDHHYTTKEEHDAYIERAFHTCTQIKEMSDRLFEYFLAFDPHPERSADSLDSLDGMEVFMQLLAEHTLLLKDHGYQFQILEPEKTFTIHVNMDDLIRVFQNIFSNLDKYADEKVPIIINICREEKKCSITFTNAIRKVPRKNESFKIGLDSILGLMRRQGGTSVVTHDDSTFTLRLELPTY